MATLLVYIRISVLLNWSRVFDLVGYDLSLSITLRDGTFLFLSAHPSTYTYDTVLILIRNYLITS